MPAGRSDSPNKASENAHGEDILPLGEAMETKFEGQSHYGSN
jgi:hypothetical protein